MQRGARPDAAGDVAADAAIGQGGRARGHGFFFYFFFLCFSLYFFFCHFLYCATAADGRVNDCVGDGTSTRLTTAWRARSTTASGTTSRSASRITSRGAS